MAYGPRKARSELVTSSNFPVARVLDNSLMFHDAVAASYLPARRPTRGSGIGSPGDMLLAAALALVLTPEDEIAGAHAAAEMIPSARDNDNSLSTVTRAGGRYSADIFVSSGESKLDGLNGDTRDYSTVMPRLIAASIFSMRAISVV